MLANLPADMLKEMQPTLELLAEGDPSEEMMQLARCMVWKSDKE